LYVTHPELFGGELKIAENFTTVRVPSWDAHILDLAFSIKESSTFLFGIYSTPAWKQVGNKIAGISAQ
jgi:hypothetical protein